MVENYVYYDWECNVCEDRCCCCTTENHPKTYINSFGKQSYACRYGKEAIWIPVKAHERDMQLVEKLFGGK